jgi:hypothetical protein
MYFPACATGDDAIEKMPVAPKKKAKASGPGESQRTSTGFGYAIFTFALYFREV